MRDKLKPVRVGLLGADIEFDGSGFRIARIIPGQPWGEDEFTSPLEAAHLGVKPGMFVLAVNGVPLSTSNEIYELLQDQAEKFVRLTIADDARGTNTRTIEVKTLSDEHPLRYAAWVEANRKYVAEKSEGRLGYLHIPDMGGQGLVMFSRYFYPQFTKQGMVVDIRDNGGGFVSQMIISRLARKVWAFDQPRHGVTHRYPEKSLYGYTDVIIDQHAGSDGDIFPASFRMLELGPLIGTRTWGGVVGIRGDKPFVDMGLCTQPEFAWWEPKNGWTIENQGVTPDIQIDVTPGDRAAGRDPQLDKAIEVLLTKLKDKPMDLPKPPPWPVRVGAK
jgi:tricorn protease